MDNKNNIHDELKLMENEKLKLDENIKSLENLHLNFKNALIEQDKKIKNQQNKILLEDQKLKNEHEINILMEKNKKLEEYINLLSKKYELEIKYIEQYCDHKSKIEKISEKYSFINFKDIIPLEKSYNNEFISTNNNKIDINIENQKTYNKENTYHKPKTPPPPPIENKKNVISKIVNNPEIIDKPDIRTGPSFQEELKNAFNNKYKALQPSSNNHSEDEDSFS